jgi:hypothetical protein
MLKFIVVWGVLSTPVIAYIFARIWILFGYLWCLDFYPEWLDRAIYSMASPYLSEDMVLAANQMEFLEVWIASAVILEILFLLMIFLFGNRLK